MHFSEHCWYIKIFKTVDLLAKHVNSIYSLQVGHRLDINSLSTYFIDVSDFFSY